MKAVFPKNIQKGFFSGLTFSIGPFSISIIQLFILAIGVAAAFVVFNKFSQSSKVAGVIFAILIFLIFLVIAFFNISELNLPAFLVKMVQNHFFDATEKYQTNHPKHNPTTLLIEKAKIQNTKQKIEYKTAIQLDKVEQLDTSGLLS